MGNKSKFLGAVKKVFRADSRKKKKNNNNNKEDKLHKAESDSTASDSLEAAAAPTTPPQVEATRPAERSPPVRSNQLLKLSGRSREAAAAVRIQSAFRAYLARRTLHALKGLVRLKSLIHGEPVKRQAATTLRCMQTLARVQSQIHTRRVRMSEENHALQRQLLLKNETELERLRMGDRWDDSAQSKEQIEASLLNKQEAALRRERQLAYAFSHQWKNSSKSALFMDPKNPHWGWSWVERWMAARPSEGRSITDRDLSSDHTSVKSVDANAGGETTSTNGQRDTNTDRPLPADKKPVRLPSGQSPKTLTSKPGKVVNSASPGSWSQSKDNSRHMSSVQAEGGLVQSLVASSVKEDESLLPSSRSVPSYMVPTKSAKAKSRMPERSLEKSYVGENVGSVTKRMSLPAGGKPPVTSPAEIRRHSVPPKVAVESV